MVTNPYAWSRYKVALPRTLTKENYTSPTRTETLPIILLCYVQGRPIPGHEHFVLISNNTLVDINADINFHARASKKLESYHSEGKLAKPTTIMIRQLNTPAARQFFSPQKDIKPPQRKRARQPQKAVNANLPQSQTSRKWECIVSREEDRKGRSNPKKDKTRIKSSLYFCYMSEIELQGLLDRTNPLDDDPEPWT